MAERAYIQKSFRGDARDLIARANQIARAYAQQGFDLTLRQVYYQFVARDLFPDDRTWTQNPNTGKWFRDPNGTKNAEPNYKWLGDVINDARLAGDLDWDFIVDRTRNLRYLAHWDDPAEIVRAVASQYREDKWADQPEYIEVWIEKDALVGVLGDERQRTGVCPENDVPFFSCRGYTSQSEVWGAAQRLGEKIEEGKKVTVIHLGDHDPSGIDMSRDIEDRLALFIAQDQGYVSYTEGYFDRGGGGYDSLIVDCKDYLIDHLSIERIALNWDQVQTYSPPPNPAKVTDSRAAGYIRRFGAESWELDALDPATLVALIQNAIDDHKDFDIWGESESREDRRRRVLRQASDRWAEVQEFLEAAS